MARQHWAGLLISMCPLTLSGIAAGGVPPEGGAIIETASRVQEGSTTTLDRLLAMVGDSPITLSDVRAARLLDLVPMEDDTDALIDRLVDRELMRIEVNRFAVDEPPGEAVEARLAAVRGRFASAGGFEDALAAAGLTMAQARAVMRDELRIEAYLAARFGAAEADRRAAAIARWVESLRRRAEITIVGGQ